MATFLDQATAGASLSMPQIVADILSGATVPTVLENGLQVTVAFPAGSTADPAGVFVWSEALASPEALALFGLDASQGPRYVLVKVFAVPVDPLQQITLPSGQFPLPECFETSAYDGSGIQLQAWLLGSVSAPWQAACSSGSDCWITDPETGLQVEAPIGCTLQPGSFSGSGAIGKPRKEFAGYSSWPEGAPR